MFRLTMVSEVALRCAESSAFGTEEALGIALEAMEDAVAVLRPDGSLAMSNAPAEPCSMPRPISKRCSIGGIASSRRAASKARSRCAIWTHARAAGGWYA